MNRCGRFKIKRNRSNSIVGFFPNFWSLGETIPLIKIATEYLDLGGKVIFFSHRGKYEYLVEDIGCELIKLNDIWEGYTKIAKKMIDRGVPWEKILMKMYREEFIRQAIKEEVKVFKKNKINLIISTYNLSNSVSARALNIPLVVVISGTAIPPYYESNFCRFPENYENAFTKIIPQSIKIAIFRWFMLHYKYQVKEFNRVAKEYNVKPFRYYNDILLGDHTFVCDDINFLGLNHSKEFPKENFIGPIYHWDLFKGQQKDVDIKIKNHLNRPGKSILVSMGTFKEKSLYIKIIECLNKTDFNIIAIYSNILNKNELPKTNENILFTEFVPSAEYLMKIVDLSIIHGGRGTVYSAAYSGKPAIGIPIIIEQQYNIDNLVRHGSAISLSKKYFNKKRFLNGVEKIFNEYDIFLKNSKKLKAKLIKQNSAKIAAQRLIEIIQSKYEN